MTVPPNRDGSTPFVDDPDFTLYVGDVTDVLAELPDESVHCVVTSPPYFGLRDYGTGSWDGGDPDCDHRQETRHQIQGATSQRVGRTNTEEQRNENYRDVCGKCGARRVDQQLGLEPTPDAYVARIVDVFREVRRVLRRDGTVWCNLGDSYGSGTSADRNPTSTSGAEVPASWSNRSQPQRNGLKPKDLAGMPWRVAFALQADGWYLRADIIWSKPNPMPESVTDRPTKAHEYLFLLTRSPRYFYDADAIREPAEWARWGDQTNGKHGGSGSAAGWIGDKSKEQLQGGRQARRYSAEEFKTTDERNTRFQGPNPTDGGRNRRSVWEIATEPYPDAHFATYPQALVEPCIKAGTSEHGCCPECGAPWEREVERELVKHQNVLNTNPAAPRGSLGNQGDNRAADGHLPGHYNVTTIGWRPSCECLCPSCMVESTHDAGVRELPQAIRDQVAEPQTASAVLQPDVRESVQRAETLGTVTNDQGLHQLALAGPSNSEQAGPRDGAPRRDGEEARTLLDEGRSGPPQERGQGRQPAIEPRSDDGQPSQFAAEEATASPALPALRGTDLDSGRDQTHCRACNAPLTAVPAVVLDIFLGSGTTALVARKHGRRCIGIELNPEYAELAARRLQQQSLFA